MSITAEQLEGFVSQQISLLKQDHSNRELTKNRLYFLERLHYKIITSPKTQSNHSLLLKECARICRYCDDITYSDHHGPLWLNWRALCASADDALNTFRDDQFIRDGQKIDSDEAYEAYVESDADYNQFCLLKQHYSSLNHYIIAQHEKGSICLRVINNENENYQHLSHNTAHDNEVSFYNSRAITGNLRATQQGAGNRRIIVSTTLLASSKSRTIQRLCNNENIFIGLDLDKSDMKDFGLGDLWTFTANNNKNRPSYKSRLQSLIPRKGRETQEESIQYFRNDNPSSQEITMRPMNEMTLKVFDESLLFIGRNYDVFSDHDSSKKVLEKLIETQCTYREKLGFNIPIVIYNNTANAEIQLLGESIALAPNSFYIVPEETLKKIDQSYSSDVFLYQEVQKRQHYKTIVTARLESLGPVPPEAISIHKMDKPLESLQHYPEMVDSNPDYQLPFRLQQYLIALNNDDTLIINYDALKQDIALADEIISQQSQPGYTL